jgi:hypothetical protein
VIVEFTRGSVKRSLTCLKVVMQGCDLLCDDVVIAYFDRDSGGGWFVLDQDGGVVSEECYQLTIAGNWGNLSHEPN